MAVYYQQTTFLYTTRSTGTVHTSTKARLTSAAIWLISIRTTFRIGQWWRIWQTVPVSRWWSRSMPKFNHFVKWPIANLTWKFHANVFWSFCAKLLTDKQWRLHILLGGGEDITLRMTGAASNRLGNVGGTKVPRNERSREQSFQGTEDLRNESSREW